MILNGRQLVWVLRWTFKWCARVNFSSIYLRMVSRRYVHADEFLNSSYRMQRILCTDDTRIDARCNRLHVPSSPHCDEILWRKVEQLNRNSSTCVLMCDRRYSIRENCFEQMVHGNGFSLPCVGICRFSWDIQIVINTVWFVLLGNSSCSTISRTIRWIFLCSTEQLRVLTNGLICIYSSHFKFNLRFHLYQVKIHGIVSVIYLLVTNYIVLCRVWWSWHCLNIIVFL